MRSLIAAVEFPYAGRTLKAGEPFEASSDEDARILKGVGKAMDAPARRAAAPVKTRALKSSDALTDHADEKESAGRYQRADMRAQD